LTAHIANITVHRSLGSCIVTHQTITVAHPTDILIH
jgi:hypothetical protein